MPVMEVEIPYEPREAFLPFHERVERWGCLVAHRRAGKTVAAVVDTLRRALLDPVSGGSYALISPFRAQAKAVGWEYLKHYSAGARRADTANESELTVSLINGNSIRLYGADNPDSLRGIGLRGVYLDEYGDFKPSAWGSVIRPTLSDSMGWAVFGGTPKGHNQFYDVARVAETDPEWFYLNLQASKSGLIDPGELAAARKQLSEDQYQQEYETSFEAAILGAFYGVDMRELSEAGRIREVAYDPEVPVYTAWDLGLKDDTAIWWYQRVRDEVHVLECWAASGSDIREMAGVIESKPYRYGKHYLPHDAKAKTLASGGKSVVEQLAKYLGMANLKVVPDIGVQDGIQAVRSMLRRTWFDRKADPGIEALRQYQREYDEDKKAFRKTPRHDWTSHYADGFRMLAVMERSEPARMKAKPKGKNLHTMTLDELWDYTDRQNSQERRI